MNNVTIEIGSKWVNLIHSPLYWIVGIFQGFSIFFAPLFLYFSGRGQFSRGSEWFIVPLCLAAIWFTGFFYIRLGNEVIQKVRKAAES